MKYVQSGYRGNHEWVNILPIGDLHIGAKNFDMKVLRRTLDFVDANRENTRILLMGDLAETATKTSVGAGSYEQKGTAQDQIEWAAEIFEPYKDLIDGVITGNHEQRVYKATGVDVMKEFCKALGLYHKDPKKNRYLRYQGAVKVSWNHRSYRLIMWHGAGGGGTKGGKFNKLASMQRLGPADAYFMGHVHEQGYTTVVDKEFDDRNLRVKKVLRHFVFTGSALTYEDGYAEEMGLQESQMGFPLVKLHGKRDSKGRAEKMVKYAGIVA